MGEYILAVDIGTSACKTAIFDLNGKAMAEAVEAYKVLYPKTGWAEQDPEDWWMAACRGIQACIRESDISAAEIAAVGVDGQSWSCVPMDAAGNILMNTPIWMDTRAESICRDMDSIRDHIFEISGNPFQPSYTTPKILWMKKHFPEIYKKTRWFLQCNSFIVYRLTGIVSQDVSQGYGLHVFDIVKKQYDSGLCSELGIDISRLPGIYESHKAVGTVTGESSRLTGLAQGTPVVAGGLDAACGTLGAGVYISGQTQEQGGQAGGMSICMDKPEADPRLILSPHVVPEAWLLQGGTVGGGGSLNWLARELGQPELTEENETGINQFALLDKLAAAVAPGSDGLVFLPYLAGERSPIWDSKATGVFFGLRFSTTRGHFFRALMEGAAFALRHNLDTALEAGVRVGEMHATGGASKSSFWIQLKADITGKKIRVPDSELATCKGAAMLAGIGTGMYKSFEEAVKLTVKFKEDYQPGTGFKAVYDKNYEIYRRLYPQLKPVMECAAQEGRK